MSKKILGLDLGSNSLGWAILELSANDHKKNRIVDLGSRIFTKAVEDKIPTPKNVTRRDNRLSRRVLQRRARRKQRMLSYLISLKLLPSDLSNDLQPEIILNSIGDPYYLRTKALDAKLTPFELGRVLLHFVARRGFLSTKKQISGDLIDDPDTIAYLEEIDLDASLNNKEESEFKTDISIVRNEIDKSTARTLGEYLYNLGDGACKRNRNHEGGHLRTDRKMYQDEIEKIWQVQNKYFTNLPDNFMLKNQGVKEIIFYQRPLKLKKNRIGKCSLEPKNNRATNARLEVQRFRYLQDVNHLAYFERHSEQWLKINNDDKEKLINYFENNPKITTTNLKKLLNLDKTIKLNLEAKNLKGNITACEIQSVLERHWEQLSDNQQHELVEDLLSIKKKSALKTRLLSHWNFPSEQAIKLCLLEFEPGYSSHSLKAINKMLPYLKTGDIYAKARKNSGYGYEVEQIDTQDRLGAPPETSNPIVNKGLHELKRVVNALIKQYGKPDVIHIEMARDLEMNTKRYKENEIKQNKNKKANQAAIDAYKTLNLGKYPNYDDKIKYRLWLEQNKCCAYSNKSISLNEIFTSTVEIDHILPFKKSLDDSYMNKVLCYTAENRYKGDRTPKEAWGGNTAKWEQITGVIQRWQKVEPKVKRFFQTESDLNKDFIATQLNDTRYIATIALEYLKQLGCDISVTKGFVVSKMRHQWGFNNLLGETNAKERNDHRHHAIDAVVIAATSRSLYQKAVNQIKHSKLNVAPPYPHIRGELEEQLKHILISHDSNHKLSGALHEDTGAGYIERHGGLVYRKSLTPKFTEKQAKSIVDETVKKQVLEHLASYNNNPKNAFADGVNVYHLNGKTLIKRVRILQSTTTITKLEQNKFGIKDKSGKIFKWMAYGNVHHVEIIQDKTTGKYKGQFVTMMAASHRAKGIQSHLNPEGRKQPIVKIQHGDNWEFKMALHRNDTISIVNNSGERVFYRVQKLESGCNRFVLREHKAATIKNKSEELYIPISEEIFSKYELKKHRVNVIGIINHD